jgi:drug/metabolite transporter (DMT)-like permease
MFFLALHIAGNAAFLLLVRVGRGRRFDYPLVGLTNYATAAALAAVALIWLAPPAPDARAALFGAANGAQYQVTYVLMFALYGLVGVAVTTSLLRLAVVVPLLASITLWGEWPTTAQAVGLLLAIGALPLLSAPAQSEPSPGTAASTAGTPGDAPGTAPASRRRVFVLAAATVLISGVGLLAAKAFAELDQPDQRPVYVLTVYAVATVLAAGAWPWRAHFQAAAPPGLSAETPETPETPSPEIVRRGRIARSLALGALVGAVNIGQIWVLLPALAQVPGALAFPLAAAGGLALATLGAHFLWHERVGRRAGIGIALAMLAAALANVR